MKKSPIATKHDQGLGRRATFIAVTTTTRLAVVVSSVVEEIRLAKNRRLKNKVLFLRALLPEMSKAMTALLK